MKVGMKAGEYTQPSTSNFDDFIDIYIAGRHEGLLPNYPFQLIEKTR